MQVDDKLMPVKEKDVVFIPSNSLHTAWNSKETDLEFIIVRSRHMGPWIQELLKFLPF
jgi:oxalate decarboxylase/phosphoglucose isomerase-like protein (cupin superfamily)